jgi:hypothetical protein
MHVSNLVSWTCMHRLAMDTTQVLAPSGAKSFWAVVKSSERAEYSVLRPYELCRNAIRNPSRDSRTLLMHYTALTLT